MSQAIPQVSGLNQILITEALFRRVPRPVNLEAEHHALLTLTQQLAEEPQTLLQSLVRLAVKLCDAGSAGISLPEVTANGNEVFRWVALAGMYASATHTPPRFFSLCGHCLDQRTPQLYVRPERYFTYFEQVRPKMVECLVIPLLVGEQALGTIWVVSHDPSRQFDLEDVRVMSSLANFTAAALSHTQARSAAEAAARQEQAARQEAEQANRAKDEFFATVSHELRTPLSNMKMALQLLSLVDQPQRRKQYLQILQTECDREISLIDDLLNLQRLESGGDSSDRSAVPLQDWLSAIVEPFIYRTQAAHQLLRLDLPTELPVLLIDRIKLERIVTELVNNACKYTPAGHEIIFTLKLTSDRVIWSVSNTGIEIPSDALPRIFEKFYRVPTAAVAEQTGTGLGLALVQQLVEQLGGHIRATSQWNVTTLTVDLPRVDAEDAENPLRSTLD